MKTVAIGLPCYRPFDGRTVRSLIQLSAMLQAQGVRFGTICIANNPDLANVHNRIFEEFLTLDAERLLNIDSDTVFEPADAIKLLLETEHDIVGGNYARKTMGGGMASTPREDPAVIGALVEAEVLGTGFCSFSRRALMKLAEDAPVFLDDSTQTLTRAIMQCGPYRGRWILNDEWLCRRWQAMGEIAWIDTSIRLEHIGVYAFRPEDAAARM